RRRSGGEAGWAPGGHRPLPPRAVPARARAGAAGSREAAPVDAEVPTPRAAARRADAVRDAPAVAPPAARVAGTARSWPRAAGAAAAATPVEGGGGPGAG